jgi:hypothetical protein
MLWFTCRNPNVVDNHVEELVRRGGALVRLNVRLDGGA